MSKEKREKQRNARRARDISIKLKNRKEVCPYLESVEGFLYQNCESQTITASICGVEDLNFLPHQSDALYIFVPLAARNEN